MSNEQHWNIFIFQHWDLLDGAGSLAYSAPCKYPKNWAIPKSEMFHIKQYCEHTSLRNLKCTFSDHLILIINIQMFVIQWMKMRNQLN